MNRPVRLLGVAAAVAVTATACIKPATTTHVTTKAATQSKKLSIGFFGFAKASSFAQATWAGVQDYARARDATATLLDSNFDEPTQVNQLQDAVTHNDST